MNNKVYCKTHFVEIFHSSGGKYSAFGGDNFQHAESGARTTSTPPIPVVKSSSDSTSEEEIPVEPKRISLKEKLQSYKQATGNSRLHNQDSSDSVSAGSQSSSDNSSSYTKNVAVSSLNDVRSKNASSSVSSFKDDETDSIVAQLEEKNRQLMEKVASLEGKLAEQKLKSKEASELCSNLSKDIATLKEALE